MDARSLADGRLRHGVDEPREHRKAVLRAGRARLARTDGEEVEEGSRDAHVRRGVPAELADGLLDELGEGPAVENRRGLADPPLAGGDVTRGEPLQGRPDVSERRERRRRVVTLGERPRSAMSVSWRSPKAASCPTSRSLATVTHLRTVPAFSSVSAAAGQTSTSRSASVTKSPGFATTCRRRSGPASVSAICSGSSAWT